MTMPWRLFLRSRGPSPEASRRADRVMGHLDHLAADLHDSVIRLEQLTDRLEGLERDHEDGPSS